MLQIVLVLFIFTIIIAVMLLVFSRAIVNGITSFLSKLAKKGDNRDA